MYSLTSFLNPLSDTDKLIKIYDEDLSLKWNINPFTIKNIFVNNNIVKISLNSDRNISLDFSTINEAKLALPILKYQVEELTTIKPLRIDKSIEKYIGEIGINESNSIFFGSTSSNVVTSGTASGTASSYILVEVNGNTYKMALYL